MNWRSLAACRNTPDPDIFFPMDGTRAAAGAAKAICRRCPVLADCRSWALTHEAYGIWGRP
jgi:WhiB family redox-sensing transcriptional regulator